MSAALDRLQAEVGERERAEEALRQAQKMEAVGQLTGGIAHDFNNLLTPVIGGLELLVRGVEEPRLKRVAEAALESGRRGAKLTTQLLAFSRTQRMRMAPVPVNRVIETMMTDAPPHDRQRGRDPRPGSATSTAPCATRTSSRTRSSTSPSTRATPCPRAAR